MNNKFDELAKSLVQSATRRAALQGSAAEMPSPVLLSSILGLCVVVAVAGDLPKATITQNFTGSTIAECPNGVYCAAPDCSGAVGPKHFVELINNHYAVYRKIDGVRLQSMTMDDFWRGLGIALDSNEYAVDPQVLYDSAAGHWYACAVINPTGAKVLFAVSQSSDATTGWTAFAIGLNSPEASYCEGPLHLGFNREGVFLRTARYMSKSPYSYTGHTVIVLPKADLLARASSVARRTLLDVVGFDQIGDWPGCVVDMDNGGMPGILLTACGGLSPYPFSVFKRTDILGPVTSPTLDFGTGYPDKFFFGAPYRIAPPAPQPDPNYLPLKVDFPIHQSPLWMKDGEIWSVTNVADDGSGRGTIHWLRMSAAMNTILEEGFIGHPELTYLYPSIAVNGKGDVVIGFSASGPNAGQYASCYAIVGRIHDGRTLFGQPILLKAGATSFKSQVKQDAFGGFGKAYTWGDYSTTTLDPEDRFTFWTIQEWPSDKNTWSTQITALTVVH